MRKSLGMRLEKAWARGYEESVPDIRSVARSSDGRMKGGGYRVCGGGEEMYFKTVVLAEQLCM